MTTVWPKKFPINHRPIDHLNLKPATSQQISTKPSLCFCGAFSKIPRAKFMSGPGTGGYSVMILVRKYEF